MHCERALQILLDMRRSLEARGVAHAGIIGSVARGEATEASDIDIVIIPAAGRRLDLIDLGGVQTLLDQEFAGVEVDLVVEPATLPALRRAIGRDRVDAF